MSISVSLAPVNTEVSVSSANDITVSLTNPTTTVEVNNQALSLPQSLGTTDSPTFGSVITSQTTVVASTAQTATNFFGQRFVHTGGNITYTFAAVGSSDIGKSLTIINAGTGTITLSITTSKFFNLVAGVDPDFADSSSGGTTGSTAHTLAKGGVAEFIVAAADKIIVIGSGIS